MIRLGDTHRVLIVDDEPDVATVTRLSLRGMHRGDRAVELVDVTTGAAAVEDMRMHPDTSVILLDVVMETATAGLDACRTIREELGNRFVRILLRTGQPGVAPERATIDDFDIDGYLPKAELTTTRLYSEVRTALKAYEELVELERHRQALTLISDAACAMDSSEPLDMVLQRILVTAAILAPTSLAVLELRTFDHEGDPKTWLLHHSPDGHDAEQLDVAMEISDRVNADPAARAISRAGPLDQGFLVPIVVRRDLGEGWLYFDGPVVDPLARHILPVLAAHASNAVYATVAQRILSERDGPMYDSLIV